VSELQQVPWRRLVAEAAAIVLSILLAFAIDAWWDDRRERRAELILFERLQADFREIDAMLRVAEEDHAFTQRACIRLLEVEVGGTVPPTPEFDAMVAKVFLASRTFNPGTGSVQAFLGSEAAQHIRNQRLADRLLKWSGLVEELQEEEASLQKGVSERWTPYLGSRVGFGPYLISFGEVMAGLPGHVAAPDPRVPLTVDADFVNHVLDRFKWQQLALRDVAPVRSAVEEILALLEEEIGRSRDGQ
jgi:hypothetical protein